MSDRFLATVALVVWCVAALVAVLFGLPLLLTLLGVHVDAGLIVSVVTAGIALAAALIAYQSVSRQIKANADIVAAQIAADRSERRRAERIDVVDDALTLVDRLAQEALNYEYWSGRQNSPLQRGTGAIGKTGVLRSGDSANTPKAGAPGPVGSIRSCRGGMGTDPLSNRAVPGGAVQRGTRRRFDCQAANGTREGFAQSRVERGVIGERVRLAGADES
ncbi:MAG: hypothetical protein QOF31_4032 [Mycobacterium sp.]|jgi:hypothetical protein|nr:hypothetical protein [Mycobacterium sp.]